MKAPAPPLEARPSCGARPTNRCSTRFEAGVAHSGGIRASGYPVLLRRSGRVAEGGALLRR